jgi:hypothetical protein
MCLHENEAISAVTVMTAVRPAAYLPLLDKASCMLTTWLLLAAVGCADHPTFVSTPTEEASGGKGGEGGAAGGGAGIELVGLRRAARDAGKLIGAAVDATSLADDPTYAEVLAREFDYLTPENATKWGTLQPVSARQFRPVPSGSTSSSLLAVASSWSQGELWPVRAASPVDYRFEWLPSCWGWWWHARLSVGRKRRPRHPCEWRSKESRGLNPPGPIGALQRRRGARRPMLRL